MKIDQKKLETFLKKVNAPVCAFCGKKHWSVGDTLFQLTEFQNGNIVIGGNQKVFPLVPVVCDNCGNTLFLNAIKAGVISEETSKKEFKKDEKDTK